jgi:hypothetical protein
MDVTAAVLNKRCDIHNSPTRAAQFSAITTVGEIQPRSTLQVADQNAAMIARGVTPF